MDNNFITREEVERLIDQAVAFGTKKSGNTPTEAYDLVNRQFLTQNGVTASRPTNAVTGQMYYDTTLGKPIWWNGSAWKLADGTGA